MYKLFLRPTCTLLCGFAAMGAARAGTVSFHLDAGTLLMGAGLVCLLAWRLRSSFARRALAIALPLAAGLALSLPAIAQTVGVVHQVSDEEVAATIKYWTPERLAAAIPVPMPQMDAAAPRLATPNVQANAGGEKPGFDPAGAPRGVNPFRMPHPPAPVIPPWTGNCSDCTGDCDPYSLTFLVPEDDYVGYPVDLAYIAIGKVFFTMAPYPYGFVCSGASIGGSAVLTAGHCVSDGQGNFDTNWVFAPQSILINQTFTWPEGYDWVATQLMTFPEWLDNSDLGRDVGFAIVKGYVWPRVTTPIPIRAHLSDVAGHLGFAWNQDPTGALWNAFGYPIIAPGVDFGAGMGTGLEMVQSNSLTACRFDRITPPSVGIGSWIESGGSGGPWILHFRQTLTDLWTNYAGGLNSFTSFGDFGSDQDYSPYFDQAVKDLKDQAVRTEP